MTIFKRQKFAGNFPRVIFCWVKMRWQLSASKYPSGNLPSTLLITYLRRLANLTYSSNLRHIFVLTYACILRLMIGYTTKDNQRQPKTTKDNQRQPKTTKDNQCIFDNFRAKYRFLRHQNNNFRAYFNNFYQFDVF